MKISESDIIRRGPKPISFMGRARDELQQFPQRAREEAGRQLGLVQIGKHPEDFKPVAAVGPGAAEIRVRTHEGGTVQHRVIYVAKFAEAVYVLHAFRKDTAKTASVHIDVARARYRQMLAERREGGQR